MSLPHIQPGPPRHANLWLANLELVILGIMAPWFLVPELGLRPWMIAIPLAFWFLRLLTIQRLTTPTPLDLPILGMVAMLVIGMLVTFDFPLSLPRVVSICYGINVYYAITNNLSWRTTQRVAVPGLLLVGFIMAGLSLFVTRWSLAKLPLIGETLTDISKQLPRLFANIQVVEEGINSNQVGGGLILLIPLQVSVFITTLATFPKKALEWVLTFALGIGVCLSLFVLLLTQSRGAIATTLVVLSILALVYIRHRRWLIVALLSLSLIVAGVLVFTTQVNEQFSDTGIDEITDSFELTTRPEIWSRAYRMLQDNPFTGIGLNTFSEILSVRYPTFMIPTNRAHNVPHAHNLYLQTALDLGIPGLICFLALHVIVGWMLVQTLQNSRNPLTKATVVGLLLGLIAQLIYGWIDCIALGDKPGIFFWVYLALSTIYFRCSGDSQYHDDNPAAQIQTK